MEQAKIKTSQFLPHESRHRAQSQNTCGICYDTQSDPTRPICVAQCTHEFGTTPPKFGQYDHRTRLAKIYPFVRIVCLFPTQYTISMNALSRTGCTHAWEQQPHEHGSLPQHCRQGSSVFYEKTTMNFLLFVWQRYFSTYKPHSWSPTTVQRALRIIRHIPVEQRHRGVQGVVRAIVAVHTRTDGAFAAVSNQRYEK